MRLESLLLLAVRRFLPLMTLLFLSLPLQSQALGGNPDAIAGVWLVADGSGRIEIARCGETYCGRIVWLKEPYYPPGDKGGMEGKPLLDRENPIKELRSRPQLGLKIMEGYTFRGNNLWDDGTIYNTENGSSYRSRLSLKAPDRLELRAFLGIAIFGGSTVWKRVTDQK